MWCYSCRPHSRGMGQVCIVLQVLLRRGCSRAVVPLPQPQQGLRGSHTVCA